MKLNYIENHCNAADNVDLIDDKNKVIANNVEREIAKEIIRKVNTYDTLQRQYEWQKEFNRKLDDELISSQALNREYLELIKELKEELEAAKWHLENHDWDKYTYEELEKAIEKAKEYING